MPRNQLNPESKTCLICGSNTLRNFKAMASDATTTSPSFIHITECENCIFAWQYPLGRDEQQSVEFFEQAYADQGHTQSQYFNPSHKIEIAKLEYGFITELPVTDKTILDIGAGAGLFAEVAAKNHWDVVAVDPALDLDRIKNNPKITAIKGTVTQIPKDTLFDIVTLWDVIEHVTNPIELINNAKQYLKKDGWLIIETGNYKSADRVEDGTKHWMFQLDHRWYFSPESIKQLLIESGFSDFILSNNVLRPGWNGSTKYAGPSRADFVKSVIKNPFLLPAHISKYSSLIKAKQWEMPGIEIFAIAAKSSNI